MTLGQNIWAQSVRQVDWWKCDEPTMIALGKIIIAAIDDNFADLRRDCEAAIQAAEKDR